MDTQWVVLVGMGSFASGIITPAAGLYRTISELWPPLKKLWGAVMKILKWPYYLPTWLHHKPSIELVEKPICITRVEQFKWATKFRIKLASKEDSEETEIMFNELFMEIKQGWGPRRRSVRLSLDSKQTPSSCSLQPSPDTKEIELFVKSAQHEYDPRENVNLNKPYKWTITGIKARIWPLDDKSLKSFRGKHMLTE